MTSDIRRYINVLNESEQLTELDWGAVGRGVMDRVGAAAGFAGSQGRDFNRRLNTFISQKWRRFSQGGDVKPTVGALVKFLGEFGFTDDDVSNIMQQGAGIRLPKQPPQQNQNQSTEQSGESGEEQAGEESNQPQETEPEEQHQPETPASKFDNKMPSNFQVSEGDVFMKPARSGMKQMTYTVVGYNQNTGQYQIKSSDPKATGVMDKKPPEILAWVKEFGLIYKGNSKGRRPQAAPAQQQPQPAQQQPQNQGQQQQAPAQAQNQESRQQTGPSKQDMLKQSRKVSQDVLSGLMNQGYKQKEAEQMIQKAQQRLNKLDFSIEELYKEALKNKVNSSLVLDHDELLMEMTNIIEMNGLNKKLILKMKKASYTKIEMEILPKLGILAEYLGDDMWYIHNSIFEDNGGYAKTDPNAQPAQNQPNRQMSNQQRMVTGNSGSGDALGDAVRNRDLSEAYGKFAQQSGKPHPMMNQMIDTGSLEKIFAMAATIAIKTGKVNPDPEETNNSRTHDSTRYGLGGGGHGGDVQHSGGSHGNQGHQQYGRNKMAIINAVSNMGISKNILATVDQKSRDMNTASQVRSMTNQEMLAAASFGVAAMNRMH